jgi:hypothetical protein
MKSEATKDFEKGLDYGLHNPIDSAAHIFHEAIGTAPESPKIMIRVWRSVKISPGIATNK